MNAREILISGCCKDILIANIKRLGGDGLCYPEIECGCSVDDLAPCDSCDLQHCRLAKRREDGLFYVLEE